MKVLFALLALLVSVTLAHGAICVEVTSVDTCSPQFAIGTDLPGTCFIGQSFWDTDADTDGQLNVCSAADAWKSIGAAGAVDWDDIGDPSAAATIDFTTFAQTLDIGATDTGGPKNGLILTATGLGAGTTNVNTLLITTTANDDANFVPILVQDDSGGTPDDLFRVSSGGVVTATTFAGELLGPVSLIDDALITFGTDADWTVEYDEGVDNQLLFLTANTSAIATDDPMVEFLVGASPTADQEVFGVGKGTQASNTALFTVDEDGDVVAAGTITATTSLNSGASATPSVDFDDSGATGTIDGSINVNCTADSSCDMDLAVNSGADTEISMIRIDTTAGASVVQLGGAQLVGVDPTDYVGVDETGAPTLHGTGAAGSILYFDDTGNTGTNEGQINVDCTTLDDCTMNLSVNSGSSTAFTALRLDTDGAGATTVQLGTPGSNYISIDEAGVMTAVGTGSITVTAVTTDIIHPMGSIGTLNATTTNDNLECWLRPVYATVTPDRLGIRLNAGCDDDDNICLGVYSEDGNTQHSECKITSCSSGDVLSCTDGSAVQMPPADYWFCFGADDVSDDGFTFTFRSNGGSTTMQIADVGTSITDCDLPATITLTKALIANEIPPYLVVVDD